jgi:hypothetical protein
MIPAIVAGALAVYFILGWIAILLTRDEHATEARGLGQLVLALLFWPVSVIATLVRRGAKTTRER